MPEQISSPGEAYQEKRELNRRRRSSYATDLDSRLAARQQKEGPAFSDEQRGKIRDHKSTARIVKNVEKDAKRVTKGAAQLAAGNKVSGTINIARGAGGVAAEFFGGGFIQLGVLWYFVLCMAMAKDTIDIMSFDIAWWLDWIVDIVMGGMLWVYLAVHHARRTKIVKFAAPILEIIPFAGFLPWWTISILYVGLMKLGQGSQT